MKASDGAKEQLITKSFNIGGSFGDEMSNAFDAEGSAFGNKR